jgi:hypothetical protein
MKWKIISIAIWLLLSYAPSIIALECPKQLEQSKSEWDGEIGLAIAKIGPAKGGELTLKTKKTTRDLLSKLPKADRVYLEHMMYATYCSTLRDNKSLSETEKEKRIKIYNAEIRKAFSVAPPAKKRKPILKNSNRSIDNSKPVSQIVNPISEPPTQKTSQSKQLLVTDSPSSVNIQGDNVNINVSPERSKQPTASEIADEVVKKLKLPGLLPYGNEAPQPTFKEKIKNVKSNNIFIILGRGGLAVCVPSTQLRDKGYEPDFGFGDYKPIRVYLEQGKLFADISMYGGPGKPPIEIKHNEFILRMPGWDRNFDSSSLEIVDQAQLPILQLIYQNPHTIIINGIFYTPNRQIILGDTGSSTMPIGKPIPKDIKINRLFKYPFSQFQGKRIETTQIFYDVGLRERITNLTNELKEFVVLEENVQDKNKAKQPKTKNHISSIYKSKYASRCITITDEIKAAGINTGQQSWLCESANNTNDIRFIVEMFNLMNDQLPP